VPERVPFRLTPDMVDGLGISGTQGVYQRCAEETLRVLHDGSDVIRTVLEVFKYDPLHSWYALSFSIKFPRTDMHAFRTNRTASEIKIKRVQGTGGSGQGTIQPTNDPLRLGIGIDMASGTADEAADRALSSVTRKLDKSLSVEYTVNQLIAEATDLVNIAMMYFGELYPVIFVQPQLTFVARTIHFPAVRLGPILLSTQDYITTLAVYVSIQSCIIVQIDVTHFHDKYCSRDD
jgi:serine-protein kinase ATM